MARTNIDLDSTLVKKGLKLSKLKTKKELVNKALEDFVRRESQKEILDLFGKLDWEGDLKSMRKQRVF
jgi:Arc/MetJ family transcription regulator